MAYKKRIRRIAPPLDAPLQSKYLLVRLAPDKVGAFRFLLEAYSHLAYFSVLNKYEALLKITLSPHREAATLRALEEISESIEIEILPF